GQEFKLTIHSIDHYSNALISSYQDIQGDSSNIAQELNKLLTELQNNGFLASSIDSVSFNEENAHAYLFLGEKYKWSALNFEELEPEVLEKLKLNRKKIDIVNLNKLNILKKTLLSYYENRGYPFAKVFLQNIEIKDSLMQASLFVEKGSYCSLDSIILKGEAKITANYMSRVLQLNQGEPYNQKKINAASKRINNLRFLSEIKPAELEFKKDKVDLYLYLQNKKANTFNGIIGFAPENEETGKLFITGELNLNLMNPFGRGEEIYLEWEKMESSTQKLDVGFMYPYIFRSNLGLDSDFSLYKKDSTYLSLSAGVGIRVFLHSDSYFKGYYKYKSTTRIGDEENLASSLNFADVKSNIFGGYYYINKLDYIYNPRKGIELKLFAGAGFKEISDAKNLDDSLNLNTDSRTIEVEAGLDANFYYPIYNNFVFHCSNTTRYLDQFGDQEKDIVFFENELYRFGGAKSLKGFDESIFYASIYSLQNVEIKYLFEQNSAFYIFWNAAYYYRNITQETTEDFPWGVGIGMDFQTKAGIFSLSYAVGKQFDNPLELRTAKIHFGYISRF
ncbi:MAG: hypothetical protein C0597_01165, partial [Marinilabiliales bacterium]